MGRGGQAESTEKGLRKFSISEQRISQIDFWVVGVYTQNIYDKEGGTKWKQQNYSRMAVLKQ